MMIRSILFGALVLVGCGPKPGTPGGGDTSVKNPDPTAGVPCVQEIALECPDGQIDACLVTPAAAETHTCVAKPEAAPAEPEAGAAN